MKDIRGFAFGADFDCVFVERIEEANDSGGRVVLFRWIVWSLGIRRIICSGSLARML